MYSKQELELRIHDVWRRDVCMQVIGGKFTEGIFCTYVDIKVKSEWKPKSKGSDWASGKG